MYFEQQVLQALYSSPVSPPMTMSPFCSSDEESKYHFIFCAIVFFFLFFPSCFMLSSRNIRRRSEAGVILKFPTCSRSWSLSSVLYSFPHRTLSIVISLSNIGTPDFSR